MKPQTELSLYSYLTCGSCATISTSNTKSLLHGKIVHPFYDSKPWYTLLAAHLFLSQVKVSFFALAWRRKGKFPWIEHLNLLFFIAILTSSHHPKKKLHANIPPPCWELASPQTFLFLLNQYAQSEKKESHNLHSVHGSNMVGLSCTKVKKRNKNNINNKEISTRKNWKAESKPPWMDCLQVVIPKQK